jgi:hypothetical protein
MIATQNQPAPTARQRKRNQHERLGYLGGFVKNHVREALNPHTHTRNLICTEHRGHNDTASFDILPGKPTLMCSESPA